MANRIPANDRWFLDHRQHFPPSRLFVCPECLGEQRAPLSVSCLWCTGYVPYLHPITQMQIVREVSRE
jgi:hypothetical protein